MCIISFYLHFLKGHSSSAPHRARQTNQYQTHLHLHLDTLHPSTRLQISTKTTITTHVRTHTYTQCRGFCDVETYREILPLGVTIAVVVYDIANKVLFKYMRIWFSKRFFDTSSARDMCICIHKYACLHTHVHTHTHAHAHTHEYRHAHERTHAYTHARTQCTCARTHTYAHSRKHRHTYMTHINTYINIHT